MRKSTAKRMNAVAGIERNKKDSSSSHGIKTKRKRYERVLAGRNKRKQRRKRRRKRNAIKVLPLR